LRIKIKCRASSPWGSTYKEVEANLSLLLQEEKNAGGIQEALNKAVEFVEVVLS
jgi:hypothetical protein